MRSACSRLAATCTSAEVFLAATPPPVVRRVAVKRIKPLYSGEKGFLAKTADGGKTWKKIESGTKERLNAVQMIEKDIIYAVGENGVAIGTNDGGETMVTFRTDTKRDLKDLSFLDKHTGYVVGTGGTVLRFVRDY